MKFVMEQVPFAGRIEKLEKNIYASGKGLMRLTLLKQDIEDFCDGFGAGAMQVLDVGGGSGRFSRFCAGRGHEVILCDASFEMLRRAREEMAGSSLEKRISLLPNDFLDDACCFSHRFDLVAMHGSVEWMADPEAALRKGCSLVRPGGYLSLLVFNEDRHRLKLGINGLLLPGDRQHKKAKTSLTPPGGMTPGETRRILDSMPGSILLQSGIRVFYKFFREGVAEDVLSMEQWIEQEKLYYRLEPFSALGEHTHFIWQASGSR